MQEEDIEGRDYLNYHGEADDDDNEDVEEYDEADYDSVFKFGRNRPTGDDAYGYSGDEEDMEHYRDRIFGDLQKQIDERKKLHTNN